MAAPLGLVGTGPVGAGLGSAGLGSAGLGSAGFGSAGFGSAGRPGDLVDDWVAAASCAAPSLGPGGQIGYVGDRDGTPALWVRAADAPDRRVDTGPGHVRSLSWSPDGRWIAVLVAPGGGERTEVRVLHPDGSGLHRLAGGSAADPGGTAVAAVPGRWTPDGWALVVCESVASGLTHALLAEAATGRREHLAVGNALVICDVRPHGSGYHLLVREGTRGARRLLFIDSATGQCQPLFDGTATVAVGRFAGTAGSDGGTVVHLLSNAGRERPALVEAVLDETGTPEVSRTRTIASRDDADLDRFTVLPGGRQAAVVWNVAGRNELGLVELADGRHRVLPPLPREVVNSLLVAGGGRQLLLALEGARSPGELWTYDLASASAGYRCLVSHAPTAFPTRTLAPVATLTTLATASPTGTTGTTGTTCLTSTTGPTSTTGTVATIGTAGTGAPNPSAAAALPPFPTDPTRLVRPVLHTFGAHDGLELSGWLYRPPGTQGALPTFLYFHGGPEWQERPRFNPLFQALLARGIAVFAPNVRGSTGYGRSFEHADDRERRFAGIRDVAACVDYLVRTRLADMGRVGVGGRSYGGYLTLAALVTYPDLFRVGVDICGIVDFETFYTHTEPWIAAPAVTKYGDPDADRALLRMLSPIHQMDALAAPLLVVHGANDTNVPVYEADQTAAAARARGVPCRYLLFDGEGHEIAGLANRVLFVRAVVDWLTEYLLDGDADPQAWDGDEDEAV